MFTDLKFSSRTIHIWNVIEFFQSYFISSNPMSYSSIQDLAKNFWTSERTIYHYLEKNTSKIRIKKEHWSQLINFNDFFKVASKRLQKFYLASTWQTKRTAIQGIWNLKQQNEHFQSNFQNHSNLPQNFNPPSQIQSENQYLSAVKAVEEKYEKLQNQLQAINQQNVNLQKAKNNFEKQASTYALRYKEELNEKKERQTKFVTLQEKHTQKIEDFWMMRVKLERKFYLLLGLTILLAMGLAIFTLPSLTWILG
mgnify:CR=1 FL=1